MPKFEIEWRYCGRRAAWPNGRSACLEKRNKLFLLKNERSYSEWKVWTSNSDGFTVQQSSKVRTGKKKWTRELAYAFSLNELSTKLVREFFHIVCSLAVYPSCTVHSVYYTHTVFVSARGQASVCCWLIAGRGYWKCLKCTDTAIPPPSTWQVHDEPFRCGTANTFACLRTIRRRLPLAGLVSRASEPKIAKVHTLVVHTLDTLAAYQIERTARQRTDKPGRCGGARKELEAWSLNGKRKP